MTEPWDRQPKEGARAYAAFCIYRDAGPQRSLRKTSAAVGKAQSLIERWSVVHEWGERVADYDADQDLAQREEIEIRRQEMAERHANLATTMLARAAAGLREMDPSKINPAQLARFVEVASKLERLSRGEPSEITSTDAAQVNSKAVGDEVREQVTSMIDELAARRAKKDAA
jgi:hypothetical protein